MRPSVPFHLMPALKRQSPPRVPDRSRTEENKQTLELHGSTPHAARSSPGLGPHWRDLGSAFGGIPGRLCRLAAVRATGTKGRRRGPTTGPWPLARSPTHARPIASPDGLGGVGGLSILAMAAFWLEPGRSPR